MDPISSQSCSPPRQTPSASADSAPNTITSCRSCRPNASTRCFCRTGETQLAAQITSIMVMIPANCHRKGRTASRKNFRSSRHVMATVRVFLFRFTEFPPTRDQSRRISTMV